MSYTSSAAVLQFPSHYVPIEAEEMEYIDGGKFYGANISASECRNIASGLDVHATIIGTYSTILWILDCIPGLNIATGTASVFFAAAGTTLTLSSKWFGYAAKKGGAHLGYDSTKKKLSCGYGYYK